MITFEKSYHVIFRGLVILFFVFNCCLSAFSLEVGEVAPNITLSNTKGEMVELSSLRGKIVLIDFWASWCGPCRDANPIISEVYKKYHPKGFEIYSISLDEDKDLWEGAIKEDQVPWQIHVSDLKGWASDVVQKYGVIALPTAFLVDREGKIISKDPMPDDLDLELEDLFLDEISFYPKTVDDKIFISMPTKYKVYDSSGKKLLKGEGDEINLSWLEPGEYKLEYGDRVSPFKKKKPLVKVITFYPQSVTKKITLSEKAHYEIHSFSGELMKEGEDSVINIEDWDSGLYYLVIEGHTEKFYKK